MSIKKNLVLFVFLIVILLLVFLFVRTQQTPRELTQEERNELIRKELNAFVPNPEYSRNTPEEIKAELNLFQPSTGEPTPDQIKNQLENI